MSPDIQFRDAWLGASGLTSIMIIDFVMNVAPKIIENFITKK